MYQPPTHIEARNLLKALELTGSKAAAQCGMKNSRRIRRFTSESGDSMPYTILFTLIAKNKGMFVSVENWRDDIKGELTF